MTVSFVHLNLHTEYSLVDGLIRINDLVRCAADNGMPALAVSEQSNLFSLVKFYREAERAGVKPITGTEIRLVDNENTLDATRMILLCQDITGYRNLTRLITLGYREGQSQGKAHIHRDWLRQCADGLIALSGGREGDVGKAILAGNQALAEELLGEWLDIFPDRYYLELQRTGRSGEEQYIVGAVELAGRHGIPVVATNDVRFLKRDDYEAHEARVCIQQGYTLNDPRRPREYSDEQYFRSGAEMCELFADIPEATANTLAIAKRCNIELTLGKNFLPHFPVPDDYNQDDWLRHESNRGLEKRFADGFLDQARQEEYQDRLLRELDVIIAMGFAGYFLIVADFIAWAKKHGIPVGPGRGSGAGSLVAYALGITELDPLTYDLLFERFLNPERVSLPDFDIDFCMDRRDEVIDYVAARYGREHVSQIITYGSMAAKAVVRDAGRVLGHPYGFVDQIAKLIPFELNMTLERALQEEEILRQRYNNEEEVNTLINLAMKLEGLSRNAGRHAGGIVIAPEPLIHYMPLYCEQGAGTMVTQFDMGDVEAIGLVKFDFLGLRTLTIIDHAVRDINQSRTDAREHIRIESIPLDDRKAYELIGNTDTTAIFQLESDGMKKLIKRLQPDCFDDLIALVALFRPGPLQSGMVDDFVERKHGRARVAYAHPKLESILKPTYGVILYQEQVMQIAQVLAGYTLGAADLLRRAMGKKKPEEMAKQRQIFTEGAVRNGVEERTATYIFDLMEKFAGYGFNKSHSAAYALIAYQTAWLKAHFPAAFMAAVLSSDMDNTDKVVMLLDELNRMNIRLEPPHINKSAYTFTVTNNNSIRYGLGAIKGVGKSAIDTIIEERERQGEYSNLFDFTHRVDTRKVNKRALEALICSGSMDGLGPNRNSMLATINTAVQLAEQSKFNSASGQDDLFGLDAFEGSGDNSNEQDNFVNVPEWNDQERLAGEKETLGFYLEGHPIIRYEAELRKFITCDLKSLRPGNVTIAGYIHRIRTRSGNKGRMAEIILDDRTARANLTVYSDRFQQYRNLLVKDELIIVKGEVVNDDYLESGLSVIAREIYDIEHMRDHFASLSISLDNNMKDTSGIIRLKQLLQPFSRGKCRVRICYRNNNAVCDLDLGDNWRIHLTDNLLESLKNTLGNDNVRIEYNV